MKAFRKNLLKTAGMLIVVTAAVAFAQEAASQDLTVQLSDGSTSNGQFLADGNGMPFYLFLDDHGSDTSTCTGDCATMWTPVTVASADAKPTASDGIDASLFGTITRDDGTFQVTYNGYPLYRYSKDMKAGDVNGQAVGSKWYLVTAAGAGVDATMPQ